MTKFSTQREIISRIIMGNNKHMSAEEVAIEAKKVNPKLGIATVYRNLNLLVEDGKIRKIRDRNQGYVYDGNVAKHYHFECLDCGAIYDLPIKYNSTLDDVLEKQLGLNVENHETTFYGHCAKCKREKGEN